MLGLPACKSFTKGAQSTSPSKPNPKSQQENHPKKHHYIAANYKKLVRFNVD